MDFSVNMQRLVYMSLDTINGHFNYHFMVRLLEAIVIHLNLDKIDVDFSGPDALRARNVYNGKPDGLNVPLNSKFLMKKPGVNKDLDENKNNTDNIQSKIVSVDSDKNIMLQTEADLMDSHGTLNLRFLKEIENMISDNNYEFSENEREKRNNSYSETYIYNHNYDNMINNNQNEMQIISENEVNIIQNVNEIFMEKIETLSSRVDELEVQLRKIPPVPLMTDVSTFIECSSDSDSADYCSSISKSAINEQDSKGLIRKKVRIRTSPKEIIEPKKPQVPAATLQKTLNIYAEEPEEENISVSFQIPHAGGEKYILTHNEPEVLMKHIEKLLARVNKIELISQILLSNAGEPKQKSSTSEYLSDSDDSDADNDYIKNFKHYEDLNYDSKLLQLCRGDVSKFQREYGLVQKKKILKETLSIGKFRMFFGDYTEKFEIINDLLSLQYRELLKNKSDINDLFKNKVSSIDYQYFKESVMSTHISMKNDIADYILRDPEAAGIIQLAKGVCVSCAKPTAMTAINKPFKHRSKNVFIPKPPSKAYLSYELDRIRSKYNQVPNTNDANILETICKSIVPGQKKKSHRQARCNILLDGNNIISSNTVVKTVKQCDTNLK